MPRLLLLILVVITIYIPRKAQPLTAAAVQIGTQERFNSEAHTALSAYRGMVEEHILGVAHALRIIANSSEARSAKWDEVNPLLTTLSTSLPTDATSWFVLPDGHYYTTDKEALAEESLKDRPYFSALMSGKEVFGDLVISRSTQHRSVIVAAPVVVDGRTVAGVGVSLRVRLLSQLVDGAMHLPENQYFYALERDTKIALHRRAERMFSTPADIGDEALGEQFKSALKQDKGVLEYTLNGRKIAAIYERSPQLGWYFFIAKEV
jgi:methyl-accepting chemotaxis protein